MRKVIFYLPLIISLYLYGMVALNGIGGISPIVLVWLILFLSSGLLLGKDLVIGALPGMLPGIHLIYMGTKDTGQVINETPIGFIIIIFYVICGCFVCFMNKRKRKKNK